MISIIMPLFNHEEFVKEAIESIIQQSYKDWELIIVNDGSGDNSKKIAGSYSKRFKKIKLINHLINKGIAAARNTGIKHSKGEYIAFLSSDDRWKPSFLKEMLNCKGSEKSIVFCNYDVIGRKGGYIRTQDFREVLEIPALKPPQTNSFDKMGFKNKVYICARERDMFVNYSAILGDRECFEGINDFCEEFKFGEDLYHLLKVCRRIRFIYFPMPLVEYRQHTTNTTNRFLDRIKDNNKRIFEKVKQEQKQGAKNILNIGRDYTKTMEEWKDHFDKYWTLYPYDHKMRNLAFNESKDLNLNSPNLKGIIDKTDIFIFHIQYNGDFSCEIDWNEATKDKDVYTFVDNINVEINKDYLKKFRNVFCNDLKIANKFKIKYIPFMDIEDFTKLLFQKDKEIRSGKLIDKSEKINILNISFSDCAGIMAKWKSLFDKYSEKYTFRNLVNIAHTFKYKFDLLPNSPELIDVVKNTDIFIFYICIDKGEFTNELIEDGVNSYMCDIDWSEVTIGKKVYAFLNGSTNLRYFAEEYRRIIPEYYSKVMCSTPDLALLFKFAKYIPVPLEMDTEFPERAENKVTICHLPTDPNIKNTKEFEEVCRELKEEFPLFFDYKVITLIPNKEAINIKKKFHLCFDHMQGYYGVNSLEAAAVGCIPLVGINRENLEMFRKFVNADTTPFEIVRNREELKNCIKYYIFHMDEMKKKGKECYKWMKKYWNPKKHFKQIEEFLEQ